MYLGMPTNSIKKILIIDMTLKIGVQKVHILLMQYKTKTINVLHTPATSQKDILFLKMKIKIFWNVDFSLIVNVNQELIGVGNKIKLLK